MTNRMVIRKESIPRAAVKTAMVLCCVLGAAIAAPQYTGLKAWYPLNGNAADSSGSNLHGTVYGTINAVTDRFGRPASAYRFPGTGGYIRAYADTIIPHDDVAKTLTVWFKFDTTALYSLPQYAVIAGFGDSAVENASFQFGYRYDYFCVNGYGFNNYWQTFAPISPYLDLQWHCAAIVYDNQVTKLYVDTQKLDQTNSYAFPTQHNRIVIGIETDFNGWNYRGYVDDVGIFNRALTIDEIKQIYTWSDQSQIMQKPFLNRSKKSLIVITTNSNGIVFSPVTAMAPTPMSVDIMTLRGTRVSHHVLMVADKPVHLTSSGMDQLSAGVYFIHVILKQQEYTAFYVKRE
ncbi:MAG: LamG domain-containing protein [Chitinivibrionales bacterium]|nr:LamG domain-containing protein [Chitinivibrionales bacterium]